MEKDMGGIYDRIKDKNIVIWGTGTVQKDLEGLYPFLSIRYYVDDNIYSADAKIFPPQRLTEEDKENIIVIICAENQIDIIFRLNKMGYMKKNYILVQEFFFDICCFQKICSREIFVWGTGDTYLWHEYNIRRYLKEISGFIVSKKNEEEFQGKKVYSIEELCDKKERPYIIVASVYHKDIYDSLKDMGLAPGKDFIHIQTLELFGSCIAGINGQYQFDCRKKDAEDLVVVLAGYKEFIWESIFSRLKNYAPESVDVCVVTSGLENLDLRDMCQKYNWSYLSTSKNNVSFAVNIAICLHSKAEYIYKMDEDMFVTKGVFETMKQTYLQAGKESRYEIGFVAPLVPVNGYGHVRLLEIFDGVDLWEEQFGELRYTDCFWHHNAINHRPEAARFMWGEGNPQMSDLDEMAGILHKREFQYSICPLRYSIGFILFRRETWMQMGTFQVLEYRNIGLDEEWICQFCMMQGRAIVIAENAIAGHLSYGDQNETMKAYYDEHKEKFLPYIH